LLLTLLFLNAVGLRRTWDLRGYVGDALALLTGRDRAYGYRRVEHVLSDLARAGSADPLTDAMGHHAPPRFPLHIFAVDGETVLGREWPLTRPYHA